MKITSTLRSAGSRTLLVVSAWVVLVLPGAGAPLKGDSLVVGFLYVGPKDDHGYNQASALAAAVVKRMPGVKILEVEKLPEDNAVQAVMKNMIEIEGAKIIFATSFGYLKPHVLIAAKKYPNVHFLHCGGPPEWIKDAPNVYTYTGNIDECQYLSGIVAGRMTKSNKLGFVAAKPIPLVVRNINAFALGARSVNPKAEVHVCFTGNWSEPVKEADATELLLDKGCDVFTCHVDSPKVMVEAVEKAGKYSCGFQCNQSDLAPNGYLTGAEWNWERLAVEIVTKFRKGEKVTQSIRGGLKEGIVKMSPYGKAVTEQAKKDADAARVGIVDGSRVIFQGPLKNNEGKIEIAAGTKLASNDPELDSMRYFVEGVVIPR